MVNSNFFPARVYFMKVLFRTIVKSFPCFLTETKITQLVFDMYRLFAYLRPPRGVCEAHLHQAYKPCVIGAIPSQTYENVWWCPLKLAV